MTLLFSVKCSRACVPPAFEEYIVRQLTKDIIKKEFPEGLAEYILRAAAALP